MKPLLDATRSLRKQLVRCAALLTIGAAMAASTHVLVARATDAQAIEGARRHALKTGVQHAAEEAMQAAHGNACYGDLLARGVVGPERRLDWLEHLAQIKQALPIGAEFELAPQQALAAGNPPAGTNRFQFMASTMKLQLSLAHEQDLLDFFDTLGKSVPAMLRVRSCKLERAEPESSEAMGLKADCVVDWITLKERA